MFNLLNTEEKKHVARLRIYYILKSISFFAISLTTIVLVTLIFSYLLLDGENNSLLNRLDQEKAIKQEEKIVSVNEAISHLNQTMSRVTELQSTYIKWTTILTDVSFTVPAGVTLDSLNIKSSDLKYVVTGTADTRDSLLQFQSNLESLEYVNSINSPVTNFTQKENINFTINGELSNEIIL